jgi:hypothetical protein
VERRDCEGWECTRTRASLELPAGERGKSEGPEGDGQKGREEGDDLCGEQQEERISLGDVW